MAAARRNGRQPAARNTGPGNKVPGNKVPGSTAPGSMAAADNNSQADSKPEPGCKGRTVAHWAAVEEAFLRTNAHKSGSSRSLLPGRSGSQPTSLSSPAFYDLLGTRLATRTLLPGATAHAITRRQFTVKSK
jgi:hypothetical protein